jgi:hypothetical protein
VYLGTCIIARLRLAREKQVTVRVLPTIEATNESIELSHEIFNRVFRQAQEQARIRPPPQPFPQSSSLQFSDPIDFDVLVSQRIVEVRGHNRTHLSHPPGLVGFRVPGRYAAANGRGHRKSISSSEVCS